MFSNSVISKTTLVPQNFEVLGEGEKKLEVSSVIFDINDGAIKLNTKEKNLETKYEVRTNHIADIFGNVVNLNGEYLVSVEEEGVQTGFSISNLRMYNDDLPVSQAVLCNSIKFRLKNNSYNGKETCRYAVFAGANEKKIIGVYSANLAVGMFKDIELDIEYKFGSLDEVSVKVLE